MKTLKSLLALTPILLASPVQATTSLGYVQYPFATSSGVFMFDTSTDKSPAPISCQNAGVKHRWAVNGSTAAGQAVMSVVLSAYALHKRLYVQGTNSCTVWPDTESVDTLFAYED